MKKLLTQLTGFLCLFSVLHAQTKQKNFFAEVSAGPSFPIGKFAEKTSNGLMEKDPVGFANLGLAANVTVGYYINRSIGVLLIGGYSENRQNASSYEDYLRRYWLGGYTTIDTETNKWKVKKAMGGIFWITPLTASSKIKLLTKLTAGICKTAIPGYSYNAFSSGPGGTYRRATGYMSKTVLKSSFCYQVSVEGQYKLNDKLYALLDINCFNGAPEKTMTYNTNEPLPTSTGYPYQFRTEKRAYRLGSVNALLGLGLSF